MYIIIAIFKSGSGERIITPLVFYSVYTSDSQIRLCYTNYSFPTFNCRASYLPTLAFHTGGSISRPRLPQPPLLHFEASLHSCTLRLHSYKYIKIYIGITNLLHYFILYPVNIFMMPLFSCEYVLTCAVLVFFLTAPPPAELAC